MNVYKSGEIYFCNYPKFVQIPETRDYNIDSQKPNPTPRPLVVLQSIDENRIIAVPISSDGVGSHKLYPSYIPISKEDYPEFLNKDSFIKTNQVQTVDTKWLYPTNNPKKVGELKPLELDRAQIRTLFSTQTESAYVKWISEMVAQHVKVPRGHLENRVIDTLNPLKSRTINPRKSMGRGDVFFCHFQPETDRVTEHRIIGEHKAIVLTDAKYLFIPPGQSIVIPLIENLEKNAKYFSSNDVVYVFGEDDETFILPT